MHMCKRGIRLGERQSSSVGGGGSGVASNKLWDSLARQMEGTPAISIREEMAACCLCTCV